MPKRNAEKEAFWRGALAEQLGSGLSVRQYCLREKIAEASFYSWKRELTLRDRERNGPDGGDADGDSAAAFVPLRVAPVQPSVASLELLHRSGHLLRIPAGFDDEALRRLLSVLEG